MADQNNSPIYNVSIYYLDNQFYITPMVRKPPGARTQVLPLYIIPDSNIKKFAEAIESAKLENDVRYNQDVSIREEWDGDNEKIWNTAQKVLGYILGGRWKCEYWFFKTLCQT